MKPVYLCGPINGRSDADCNDWREEAIRLLSPTPTKNPMDRDYRGREMEPGIAKEIVENDKTDILECGAILVLFDKPSVGTSMEVLFAWSNRVPVHVVNISGKPLSPWLLYHSSRIHESLEEACSLLGSL